jgi:hypothetical protein
LRHNACRRQAALDHGQEAVRLSLAGARGRHAFREADLGEHLVKAEVADFAVGNGYATDGKLDGSARSRKGRRRAARPKKDAAPAEAADTGTVAPVDNPAAADVDRAADRPPVDDHAG